MRAITFVALACACATSLAEAGRGGPLVKYLADDTKSVIVIDVAHARGTPIFTKLLAIAIDRSSRLADLTKAGIAVDKLVDTVVIGGDTAGSGHYVAVLDGKVDKVLAGLRPADAKPTTHGGVAVWTV